MPIALRLDSWCTSVGKLNWVLLVRRLAAMGRTIAAVALLAACTGAQPAEIGQPEAPDETGSSADVIPTSTSPTATPTTNVELVRYIHPDEWALTRQECLEEEGWIVEISIDGGIKFPDVTPEQSVEMEAANDRCGERYPIDPKYRQPLSEEQLAFLYDWYIEVNIPCMEAEGYIGFDPPSLDRFIETGGTVEQWTPIDDITDQIETRGGDTLPALYAVCPPGPPVDELYAG